MYIYISGVRALLETNHSDPFSLWGMEQDSLCQTSEKQV